MKWIKNYIFLTLSIFLLLQFTHAGPVNSNMDAPIANATPVGSNSPSNCDSTYPYCCSPPLNSLSIPDLFDELTDVIDVLEPACTNSTFKKNVSWYITVLLYIYLYMYIAPT